MASTVPPVVRAVEPYSDRRPNLTGLVICSALCLPIWAGILALIF